MPFSFTLGPINLGLSPTAETGSPEIAARGDGGFAVVWNQSAPTSAAGYALFDANGAQLRIGALPGIGMPDVVQGNGNESLVFYAASSGILYSAGAPAYGLNTGANASSAASVAPLYHAAARMTDNTVVVAWLDARNGPSDYGNVYARRLTLDGVALGPDFLVASGAGFQGLGSEDPISVTALAGGGFAAAWVTDLTGAGDGSSGNLQFRTFSPSGTGGATVTVTTNGTVMWNPVKVMALGNGNLAVAYTVVAADGSMDALVDVYRANGTLVRTVSVETATSGNTGWNQSFGADIQALDDGGFAVVWSSQGAGSTVRLQLATFDGTGQRTRDAFTVDSVGANYSADLALLQGGDLAVTWKDAYNGQTGPIQVAVLDLDANSAPLLGFGRSDKVFSWTGTVAPLAALTLTDTDTQAATAQVRINGGAAQGVFVNAAAAGWTQTTTGADLVYTRAFSETANIGAAVQAALRALVFDPAGTGTTSFGVTVTDAAGATTTSGGNPYRVTALNGAPSDVSLSGSGVAENSPAGTVVGVLRAQDVDAGDVLTFSVADNPYVALAQDGVTLVVKPGAALDYEALTGFAIVVTATDGAGASAVGVVSVTVLDMVELGLSGQGEPIAYSWTIDTVPLSGLTVTDGAQAGLAATVMIEDGALRGDFVASTVAGWTRSVLGDDILYQRDFGLAGAAATQATLRGMVFDTLGTGSTSFHVTLTDGRGTSASTAGTPFVVTAINTAPQPAAPPPIGVIAENAVAGTSLGAMTVLDFDPEDLVTLSLLPGSPFALTADNRTLVVAEGAVIDFERTPTVLVTVIATDSGGLTSSATYDITVLDQDDVFAPRINGITPDSATPGDGITNMAAYALTGTAREAGARVEVFRNGLSIGTAAADAAGRWSLADAGATSDGVRTYTAQTQYAGGVTSPLSDPFAVLLDRTAPDAPQITAGTAGGASFSNGNYTAATLFDIVGQAVPLSVVHVLRNGVEIGIAQADVLGHWRLVGAGDPLADGLYRFTAQVADAAGNQSPLAALFRATVDTIAPATPTILGLSDDTGRSGSDGITSDRTLTLYGTGEAGSRVTLTRDSTFLRIVTVSPDGTWSAPAPGSLAAGSYLFEAMASDRAGNFNPVTAKRVVTVDYTAPLRPTLQVATEAGPLAPGAATADAALDLSGISEAHAIIQIYNGSTLIGSALATPAGLWSHDTAALPDGTNVLSVTATDIAGNTSLARQFTLTTDTTPPDAPTGLTISTDTGRSGDDLVTSDSTLLIRGMAEVGAVVSVLLDGAVVGTARATVTGAFSLDLRGTVLPEGAHVLTAFATDAVGNAGAATAPRTIVVDTTAPGTPAILNTSAGFDRIGDMPSPVITGMAEANATIQLYRERVLIGSTTADGAGAWSFSAASAGMQMSEGANRLDAVAVDAAGNASPHSPFYTYTLDTLPPPAPEVIAARTTATGTLLTVAGEAGNRIFLQVGSLPPSVATVNASGLANLTVAPTSEIQSVTLLASDLAGNTTASARPILLGTAASDQITATAQGGQIHGLNGNDLLLGGVGDDWLDGGNGNDRLYGGDLPQTSQELLRWANASFTDTGAVTSASATTGGITVSMTGRGNGARAGESDVYFFSGSQYIAAGEPFGGSSGIGLEGYTGATVTLSFARAGSASPTAVAGISFRINDIDYVQHRDIVTVRALDLNGAQLAVTLRPDGNDVVSGQTVTAAYGNDDPWSVGGSVLVTVTGAAYRVEIIHGNGNPAASQLVTLTDIQFRPQLPPAPAGHNTLDGGLGNDTLVGGNQEDTLIGGLGTDTMTGGAGADLFVFNALGDSRSVVSNSDRITDFAMGVDRLDLTGIAAETGIALQLQTIAGADFSGLAGEIRVIADGTIATQLLLDIDGDRFADFTLRLDGQISFAPGLDLILL